jgi:prepilin-type N-terminal cleavage/methylation domain-containing protein
MNKRGFTLIELIAVIVLISSIALVTTVAIGKYTSYGFTSLDDQLEKQLVLSAKSYFSDNKKKLITNDKVIIKYEELKSNNYITNDLVDSNGNSCYNSYVVVTKNNKKYKYTGCISCDNGYTNIANNEECVN